MIPEALAKLAALQEPDGCFPSEVRGPALSTADRNGFTTAMTLRELRGLPDVGEIQRLRSRALDFLEGCRSTQIAGAFGFWPEDARPVWATLVPADIDDTAINTIELLRYGRLSRRDGLRTVCTVLIPNRVTARECRFKPPWIAPGAFLTWIGPRGRPNVIDCCVNANAAALMALVEATHLPGYREAVSTVADGVKWAGRLPARRQAITAFYPSIHALLDAVEHAVECGAKELAPTLDPLRQIAGERDPTAAPGCCCGAYGATVWRCVALEEAQALRRAADTVGAPVWCFD